MIESELFLDSKKCTKFLQNYLLWRFVIGKSCISGLSLVHNTTLDDAGPSVVTVYGFLRNASNAGIELESIRASRCVSYARLELIPVPFQLHFRCDGHETLATLGPASSSVVL